MSDSQDFSNTVYGSQLPSAPAGSGLVNQQEFYCPRPAIPVATPHSLTSTTELDRLAEASAFYGSKITAAGKLVALLESKLGEGKEGQVDGLDVKTSDIDCVACPTIPHGHVRTRPSHKVCTAEFRDDHPLRLLSDIGTYFGYAPTISVGKESRVCPLYRQISFINHKTIPLTSQTMLNQGSDATEVRAAEKDLQSIRTPIRGQGRPKGGVERREKAWGDYNLLNEIDLVKQYIEDCKTADRTLWGAQTVPSQASWFDQDLYSTGSGGNGSNAWA